MFNSFQYTDLSPLWLNLFLGILFDAIVHAVVNFAGGWLLVYRNLADSCVLIFVACSFTEIIIVWIVLFGGALRVFYIQYQVLFKQTISSFFGLGRYCSLLIALARASNTLFNKSCESGHPCLVTDSKRNGLQLFNIVLTAGLSPGPLLGCIASILSCFVWEFLSWKKVEFCQMLFLLLWELWFLSFTLLMWCIVLVDVEIVLHPSGKFLLATVHDPFHVLLNCFC